MLPVTILPSANKFLKEIKDKQLKKEHKEAIREIRKDPDIGELKRGDLAGIYGYDIKHNGVNYELAYRVSVNEQGDVVIIIMAGTRENFYEALKSK